MRPLQAAEKLAKGISKGCFVTGHDFSRAASAAKSTRALAPEERFFSDSYFHHRPSGPEREESEASTTVVKATFQRHCSMLYTSKNTFFAYFSTVKSPQTPCVKRAPRAVYACRLFFSFVAQ
jgi:hypothetical protein